MKPRSTGLGILGIEAGRIINRIFGNDKHHLMNVTQLPIRQMPLGGFGPFRRPGRLLDRTMEQSYIVARYPARSIADQI